MLSKYVKSLISPKPDNISGLVESPLDTRDYLLSSCVTLPVRIPEEFPPIFDLEVTNQGKTPHCVGFACAYLKQEKELRERVVEKFDGSWIYNECKKIDGLPNLKGTFFRSGLEVLKKQGAMPVGGGDPSRFKIGSYALVDDPSHEGIKKALTINGYLLAGYRGSNNGWRSAYVRPPIQGEELWGHAVTIVGYTKKYLIGLNSWGEQWGDKGYFYIPENYSPIEVRAVLTDLPTSPKQDNIGWVAEKFLDNNIVYPIAGLRVRQVAGLNGNMLTVLPKGSKVERVGGRTWMDGYWWVQIKYLTN